MGKPFHGNARKDESRMSRKKGGKLAPLEERIDKYKKIRDKGIYRNGESKYIYPKYLKSSAWLARRIAFYDKYGRHCKVCNRTNDTQMHHMSYKHLGKELDSELVVFCKYHHQEYHRLNGTQSNMISKTHAYIKAKKEKLSRETLKEETLGFMPSDNRRAVS